ncbi:bifunctional metallophosphatase/5'-nucleotidase [Flexivirga sp. ID2601S]|uniref:Bifunctional metallophosphatase/5'-nucleotidase n=1 Tax=Flexivirga aerilata TaxID=1656889 RepID=A0A849ADI8_9MICO|nr:bifunctional UDP-sugar hydrolase/5'-nucleotidase [Flexivirga aerilata]NNG38934.1 bifunctional metallophosphatase/5'-nucleotidase [Flexivirga aerilata]
MKHTRVAGAAAAVAVGAALVVPTASAATKVDKLDANLTPLNFVNTNDFHGHFTKDFACAVTSAKRELPGTTFLSAGDNIGGSPFESASQNDDPAIDYLNALGLQASAVGNHEFDKGFSDLTGRVQQRADWTYLGANVYKAGTTTPALPSYKIIDVNGVKVGVVGAVTKDVPSLVAKPGIAGLDFGDPVPAVSKVAKELKDGNPANGEADVVIAEYHEGAPMGGDGVTLAQDEAASSQFKEIVQQTDKSVDAIFTGHTHMLYAFDAPVPGGQGTRPVVQTDFYAQYLGVLQLGYNKQTGKVEQYNVANREVTAPTAACASDPAYTKAANIVDTANAKAKEIGQQQIGTLTADITTAYKDGSRDDRMRESTLSNTIAQSYVDSLNKPGRDGGVTIGVMNPGGVRAELLASNGGKITYADAASIMPFNNTVQTIDVTGAQFKAVLEQQWQPAGSSRPFLKLGLSKNVTYTFDPSAPDGSHITSVTIDGKPLADSATYKVASNSFLLAGGDNFTAFAKGTNSRDSGLIDQSLFVEWIKEHSPLSPSFAKNGVAVENQPTQVTAGQQTKITVSGLDLTSLGSPTTTSVEVLLGGKSLGTFPVTKALSSTPPFPSRNETADIVVTIPADVAAGPAALVVKAAQTGTTVTMPVTVVAGSEPSQSPSPSGSDTTSPSPSGSDTTSPTGTETGTETATGSSSVTGPPIITDGGAGGSGNDRALLLGGGALLLLGAGVTLIGRRVRG